MDVSEGRVRMREGSHRIHLSSLTSRQVSAELQSNTLESVPESEVLSVRLSFPARHLIPSGGVVSCGEVAERPKATVC